MTNKEIIAAVEAYFQSTYQGDGLALKKAFHPKAMITGMFKGEECSWTLEEFIQRVTTKPTAEEKKEIFDKKILHIDQAGEAAVVKACVVVNGIQFIDYITLLKINNQWIIREKFYNALKKIANLYLIVMIKSLQNNNKGLFYGYHAT